MTVKEDLKATDITQVDICARNTFRKQSDRKVGQKEVSKRRRENLY